MRESNLPLVRAALLLVAGAALATVALLGTFWATGTLFASQEIRQEEIAQKGAEVMPFDLEKTTHVFEKTETGGVQKVAADGPNDAEQVALIREHLEEEAAAFQRGDLSDPSEIHGEEMPGLEELEAGEEEIDIRYLDLPDGAKIEYRISEPALVTALHAWFDAQLSDHGGDAEERGASGHEQH